MVLNFSDRLVVMKDSIRIENKYFGSSLRGASGLNIYLFIAYDILLAHFVSFFYIIVMQFQLSQQSA